jgi:Flp pilus assembly protein TadD
MVREKQNQRALDLLAAAVRIDPSNARYSYVYAVALSDEGKAGPAIATLERNLKLHPYDRDSLTALIGFCGQAGNYRDAYSFAKRLDELEPGNP